MTRKVIFNLIGSSIDYNTRAKTYRSMHPNVPQTKDGRLIVGKKAGSYFHFVCWTAKPALDWCKEQDLHIKIRGGPYAMQLTLVFRNDADAAQFILRWL